MTRFLYPFCLFNTPKYLRVANLYLYEWLMLYDTNAGKYSIPMGNNWENRSFRRWMFPQKSAV